MERIINPDLKDVKLADVISLDTEFNDLRAYKAKISGISICDGNYTYLLEVSKYKQSEISDFLALLSKCKVVIAHHAKADQLVLLSNYGVVLKNWFCTMIASQIIDNGKGQKIADDWYITKTMVGNIFKMKSPHGLISCLKRYCGIDYIDTEEKKKLQQSFVNWSGEDLTSEQFDYMAGDVESLHALYAKQVEYLKLRDLELRCSVKHKLIPVLAKSELRGILIDKEKHKNNIEKWTKELNELEYKLDDELRLCGGNIPVRFDSSFFMVGGLRFERDSGSLEYFNHGSDKQVLEMFDSLGVPKPRDAKNETKSGFSVSDDNLKIYKAEHSGSKLAGYVDLLFKYKVLRKKLSTYGQKLLDCVDDDGRMRTTYGIAFTDTLRLNSSAILQKKKGHKYDSGVNLSNIPKDNDIRNIFISDSGYSFVDCDMSGQEI